MLIFYNYEMSDKYFELHMFTAEFLVLTPPNRLNYSFLLLLVNSTEATHLESTYSPSLLPPLHNSKESSVVLESICPGNPYLKPENCDSRKMYLFGAIIKSLKNFFFNVIREQKFLLKY